MKNNQIHSTITILDALQKQRTKYVAVCLEQGCFGQYIDTLTCPTTLLEAMKLTIAMDDEFWVEQDVPIRTARHIIKTMKTKCDWIGYKNTLCSWGGCHSNLKLTKNCQKEVK